MAKWLFFFSLLIQAHFAASYLVPLKDEDTSAMGGVLRWAWPWADGDSGPLGTLVAEGENPLAGIFLALTSASLLVLAAMAVAGWWVPTGWWRALATAGAALLVVLMALFFGPTKIIPIAFALGTLYITLARPGALGLN
jgi:hypothetical protein